MHARLQVLLRRGARVKEFRAVDPTDFYRLVFPHDTLLRRQRPTPVEVRALQRWLWDIASRFLAPQH